MHFDDRLATVLRQRPAGDTIARIQFRQILDILGTLPSWATGPRIADAYDRLDTLSASIAVADRARILRESTVRLRNSRLVERFAKDDPPVATAAIAAAVLSDDDWAGLVPRLPVRARGILRHRRGLGPKAQARLDQLGVQDRALPSAPNGPGEGGVALPDTPLAAPPVPANDGIGAIVQRIEAFRKRRDGQSSVPAPRLPLGDPPDDGAAVSVAAFDFLTDADGRIVRADPAVAPMVIGINLGAATADRESRLAGLMRRRLPVAGSVVDLDGAAPISGRWRADATPRFAASTGAFRGYAGRLRRLVRPDADAPAAALHEADRIRQMLHELRTPLNAIQLGAEFIQQQMHGPAPHEYRAMAAHIAGDAARIMAGFDELDRLARLDAGLLRPDAGESDLGAVVRTTVERLAAHTGPRNSGFRLGGCESASLPLPLAPVELERLIWRLLAALAGAAAPSEVLEIQCITDGTTARLTVELPAGLAAKDGDALFNAGAQNEPRALSAGSFGLGFALRLAAAEARAAGGSLRRDAGRIHLSLPMHTDDSANLSHG